MRGKDVLKNLKGYTAYDYQKYPLSKTEAQSCIKALEHCTDIGVWEQFGHTEGDDYVIDGVRCSKCQEEPPLQKFATSQSNTELSYSSYVLSKFCPSCGKRLIRADSDTKLCEVETLCDIQEVI